MNRYGFERIVLRGLQLGVMLGMDMNDYLPLYQGAFDIADHLLGPWMHMLMGRDCPSLSHKGWFTVGHYPGVHVWAPPPIVALDALEQLTNSGLKRQAKLIHVVLTLRLLYNEEWRRQFKKEVNFWFLLWIREFLPHSFCEPIIIVISFPLCRSMTSPPDRPESGTWKKTAGVVTGGSHGTMGSYA